MRRALAVLALIPLAALAGDGEGRALRLRAYFSAADGEARARALEALESVPVPASPEERAKALREGLALPRRDPGTRFAFEKDPEAYVGVPRGFDPRKLYPAVLSIHGRHGDRHDGLRPFALPEEEWAELRKPIEEELKQKGHDLARVTIKRPPVNVPWEDGLVLAPTVADKTGDEMPRDRCEQACLALIARANREFPVNQDRLVLAGISMGAGLASVVASRHPDRFAGVLELAGGTGPEHLVNLRPLQVLVVHGAADKVVPVAEGQRTHARLTEAGVTHVYREVANLDHRWPKPGTDEARFVRAWLRERVRVPWPRAIDHRFEPSEKARRVYWLSIPPGTDAHVVARAKENELDLDAPVASVTLHLGEPLVDLEKEVVVRWGGREVFRGKCARSWRELLLDFETDGHDVPRAAPARLEVKRPE